MAGGRCLIGISRSRRSSARSRTSRIPSSTSRPTGSSAANRKETFVLAYNDRLDLDRLERLIQPSQFRGQPVELLTLSACETAAGDDRAALGLAGVAVRPGRRSAAGDFVVGQ